MKGGRWHERTDCDFEDNAFGELREGKDFTDVTLACEDGQQVEAHKVILAVTSPSQKGNIAFLLRGAIPQIWISQKW